MSLAFVPLTLDTLADGKLGAAFSAKQADIIERIRQGENGEVTLADRKGSITLTIHFEADPAVGGIRVGFDEPKVRLPKLVRRGEVAIERDGVLVVATEGDGEQQQLLRSTDRVKSH